MNAAGLVEQQFGADQTKAKAGTIRPLCRVPGIDTQPHALTTQKPVSHALHSYAAAGLLQGLCGSNPVAAAWHISCPLPGSGSWLRSMLQVNIAPDRTWGAMFCLHMLAQILEDSGLTRCLPGCSCTGWQMPSLGLCLFQAVL